MKISARHLVSLITEVTSEQRARDLITQADDMMSSAWHADADEPHFRHRLEMLISLSRSRGRCLKLIDIIINKMRDCSQINSDLTFATEDGDDEKYVKRLRAEFAKTKDFVHRSIKKLVSLC